MSNLEMCRTCGRPVYPDPDPKSPVYNLPESRYWKSTFSSNMRIREDFVSEVYCGAACSLAEYQRTINET